MVISVKKCTPSDLETLAELSKRTFVDAFEKQNDPKDFWAYTDEAFTIENIASQLHNPKSHFYFVYVEGSLAGYFKLNEPDAQSDLNEPETIELERIYISKEIQGKGIGGTVLKEAVRIAETFNPKHLWLGVWEHNQGAIRFYEKYGFVKFGEHPYWLGNDKQTDWLMKLSI